MVHQTLHFITGNEGKFLEVAHLLPGLRRISMDLVEVQSLDPQEVIAEKLKEAARRHPEMSFLVEDTSLYLDCLNGFPGPLIKWFMQSLGCRGIFDLCERYANFKAWAETVIGLKLASQYEPIFFSGRLDGRIVEPQGEGGFGWDPIFVPEGEGQSLANLKAVLPGPPAMRLEACKQLAEYLGKLEIGA